MKREPSTGNVSKYFVNMKCFSINLGTERLFCVQFDVKITWHQWSRIHGLCATIWPLRFTAHLNHSSFTLRRWRSLLHSDITLLSCCSNSLRPNRSLLVLSHRLPTILRHLLSWALLLQSGASAIARLSTASLIARTILLRKRNVNISQTCSQVRSFSYRKSYAPHRH